MESTQTYRAVQAVAPGRLELIRSHYATPVTDRCEYVLRSAACAIPTPERLTACFRSNGHACQAMRL